ncbi:MAG: HamA C-terminal domain-containing protein [Thermotogota bacterium]
MVDKTILYQYSIPHSRKKIDGINLCNYEDDCYDYSSDDDLIELIYNSIIEYSFNEFEITEYDYSMLLDRALITKLKYHEWQDDTTKIKYGFYGEVLLYAVLHQIYQAAPVISRGYFYNPLENSETKGYDSYHLVEDDGKVELWFGEVKFRDTLMSGAKSAIEGLDKALSDEYLKTNILAMDNHRNDFAISGSSIENILNSWRKQPLINITDELKKYNMTLVYPVLLIYPDKEIDYDKKIRLAVDKINKKFDEKSFGLSIEYKLFFIFLPITETKKIKKEVLKWIKSKKLPML